MGVGRAVSPVEVRYWGEKFEGNSSKLTDGQFGVSLGKQRNMADRPHCQKLTRMCISPRNAVHGRTGLDGSVAIQPLMVTSFSSELGFLGTQRSPIFSRHSAANSSPREMNGMR